ncbi:hypothetical protein [Streptomyces malaysiensis]|uniref:hypothetical protein n=1 Tax=Streptomyces malaysiensis TaxID=92644 RepID=UPI0036A295CB
MAKLPSDAEMSKLFVLGVSNAEIAARYDVSVQAVDFRWRKLELERMPVINQANAIIGKVWKVTATQDRGSHHAMSPVQSLRVWLRLQLGDKSLSERQRRAAVNFEKRIRRDNVVLAYDPETVKGFSWEPRTAADDRLVIRVPSGAERPPAEDLKPFVLPDAPTE